MILFEMLVGQPPFLAPTPTETQIKVSDEEKNILLIYKTTNRMSAWVDQLSRSGSDQLNCATFCGRIAGVNVTSGKSEVVPNGKV